MRAKFDREEQRRVQLKARPRGQLSILFLMNPRQWRGSPFGPTARGRSGSNKGRRFPWRAQLDTAVYAAFSKEM